MITNNKYEKLAFQIFSVLCIIAIGVCIICDFAINKAMIWSGYPMVSILFAWTLAIPLLLCNKHKVLLALVDLTITIIPFLYILERLVPIKGWFFALGLPIAIISIAAIWISFIIIIVFKVSKWYLSAIFVFLFGVIMSTTIRYYVNQFVGKGFFSIDNIVNLFSCIVITALLVIVGYNKEQNERHKPENLL